MPWTVPAVFLSLDGRPGRRVPHVWVERDGKRVSTVDVVGTRFTLLVGDEEAQKWKDAAGEVSKEINVQVDVYSIGATGDLVATPAAWQAAAGVSGRGALLVRPDDFVAKRWRKGTSAPADDLRAAIKQVLCL